MEINYSFKETILLRSEIDLLYDVHELTLRLLS